MKSVVYCIEKNFSLDIRSLALFRVSIGFILLFDFLFHRLPYFTLFYTEDGLLPISYLLGEVHHWWAKGSSLNFVYPESGYQMLLFILAVFFFGMLMLGYKTKWAVLGSWLLYISFYSRNGMLMHSGDIILQLCLFWCLRLPLGACFSIDSVLKKNRSPPSQSVLEDPRKECKTVFSFNSFAFISQVLIIYIIAFLAKGSGPKWADGTALYYAMMGNISHRTILGDLLLEHAPGVLPLFTYLSYYFIEGALPVLFLFLGFFWSFRIFTIVMMGGFHVLIAIFLYIGFFPWTCVAMWLTLLPSEFWDKINNTSSGSVFRSLNNFLKSHLYNRFSGIRKLSTRLLCVHAPLKRKEEEEQNASSLLSFKGLRKFCSLLSLLFFVCCFIYVLAWVKETLKYNNKHVSVEWWNQFGHFLHLHQYWKMFDTPGNQLRWLILYAQQADGQKIDLFRNGQPVSMQKPKRYRYQYPNIRLLMLIHYYLLKTKYKIIRLNYMNYLCEKWNKKASGPNRIKSIEWILMRKTVPPPERMFEPQDTKKRTVQKVVCF